MDRRMQRPS